MFVPCCDIFCPFKSEQTTENGIYLFYAIKIETIDQKVLLLFGDFREQRQQQASDVK